MTASKNNYMGICEYLKGKTDIYPFETEHPVYGLFTKMKELPKLETETNPDIDISYSYIEKCMGLFLSGNLGNEKALVLKQAILESEKVYIKLLRKIDMHVKTFTEQNLSSTFFSQTDSELAGQMVKKEDIRNYNKPGKNRFVNRNAIVSGILASAAILLILFILPIELQQDLDDLYNFDSQSALNYQTKSLRGNALVEDSNDPDYKLFRQHFKQGMASYLVQDYELALEEWKIIEDKLPDLRKRNGFAGKEEQQLKLYSAISYLSLALSENKKLAEGEKKESLSKAINIFKEMHLDNDTTKYYFALSLALNKNMDQSKRLLKDINPESTMYSKRIVLEEHINQ
ncbi:MAG: hypothetical protein D8M58_12305 [Calditrichaeota bacterium]|nr:MAG: hypothetical protein DWQ03_13090 [Calditrichota bacterium]MBL1206179.1 hypothetical protein [Calditrichota bacterium]NOG46004.1 hypothetical protein [Calditrichota bacterium]